MHAKTTYFLVLLTVLTLSSLNGSTKGVGKQKPNLSGAWLLLTETQDAGDPETLSLVIDHNDPELKITRRHTTKSVERKVVLIYYTDGRGETNSENGATTSTRIRWDGNTIISTSFNQRSVMFDNQRIDATTHHYWKVSKDGNGLTDRVNGIRTG